MEEKADLRACFAMLKAERVVLILRAELLGAEAALADDVRCARGIGDLHPCLQGDCFIQAEMQLGAVGDFDGRLRVELPRGVCLRKAWIGRRTRPCLFAIIKSPLCHWRGGGLVRGIIATAVVLCEGRQHGESGGDEVTERHASMNATCGLLSACRAPHFSEGEKNACGNVLTA